MGSFQCSVMNAVSTIGPRPLAIEGSKARPLGGTGDAGKLVGECDRQRPQRSRAPGAEVPHPLLRQEGPLRNYWRERVPHASDCGCQREVGKSATFLARPQCLPICCCSQSIRALVSGRLSHPHPPVGIPAVQVAEHLSALGSSMMRLWDLRLCCRAQDTCA